MNIFLIEDDAKLVSVMRQHLHKYGFKVQVPKDFSAITTEFQQVSAELILLDINLPYFDGFYWCQKLREITTVPILFISARDSNMDQVMALEYGADDYLIKPFSYDLLLAKIRSNARRVYGEYAPKEAARLLEAGKLCYYPEQLLLCYKEKEELLTRREGELMLLLINAYPKLARRESILNKLWDDEQFVDDNTLSVNVGRLRKKMLDLGLPQPIQTIRGQGYMLHLEDEE